LKNLIAQLSLLLSNAGKHRDNPEFQDDMVQTIANAVDKMTRLLSQLRGGYSLEPPAPVKVHDVVRQAVAARCGLKPAPRFESSAGSLSVIAHSARLERVIGHLIQNAVEATPSDGQVTVQLSRQSDLAVIEISDTGCGMSEQFMRSRLYKPFESTKLTGMGIGTYETQQYVRELGGRIDVQTRESQGTTFRVMLPLELPDCTNAPGYTMEGHV
jgi:putative PEP-CTERM system histidine kinase